MRRGQTNLQNQINQLGSEIADKYSKCVKYTDKASAAEVAAGTNDTKYVTPASIKSVTSMSGYMNGYDPLSNTSAAYGLNISQMYNPPIDFGDTMLGNYGSHFSVHAGANSGIASMSHYSSGSSAVTSYGKLYCLTKYGTIKLIAETSGNATSSGDRIAIETQYLKAHDLFVAIVRQCSAASTTAYFIDSSGNVTTKTFTLPVATTNYTYASKSRMIYNIPGSNVYRWALATGSNVICMLTIDASSKTVTPSSYTASTLSNLIGIGGNRILYSTTNGYLMALDLNSTGTITIATTNGGSYGNDFLTYSSANACFYMASITTNNATIVRYTLLDSGNTLTSSKTINVQVNNNCIFKAENDKLVAGVNNNLYVIDIAAGTFKSTQFSKDVVTTTLTSQSSIGKYAIVGFLGGTIKRDIFLIDLNTLGIVRYVEVPAYSGYQWASCVISNTTYMMKAALYDGNSGTDNITGRLGLVSYNADVLKVIGGVKK